MFAGIKRMIERCMERMQEGACATCDNRKVCPAGRWQHAFKTPAQKAPSPGRSFLAFLANLDLPAARAPQPPADSFRARVQKAAEALLPKGEANVDQVARELGVSRQTLYRRLKAEGVTFEELLDETRKRLALNYLKREKLSVKAVAYKLGFSDPAAFSRAFKRWTGSSPAAFRTQP